MVDNYEINSFGSKINYITKPSVEEKYSDVAKRGGCEPYLPAVESHFSRSDKKQNRIEDNVTIKTHAYIALLKYSCCLA